VVTVTDVEAGDVGIEEEGSDGEANRITFVFRELSYGSGYDFLGVLVLPDVVDSLKDVLRDEG